MLVLYGEDYAKRAPLRMDALRYSKSGLDPALAVFNVK